MEQVTIEESKEADTAARQAAHRVSRGLHNKVCNVICDDHFDNFAFDFTFWVFICEV